MANAAHHFLAVFGPGERLRLFFLLAARIPRRAPALLTYVPLFKTAETAHAPLGLQPLHRAKHVAPWEDEALKAEEVGAHSSFSFTPPPSPPEKKINI